MLYFIIDYWGNFQRLNLDSRSSAFGKYVRATRNNAARFYSYDQAKLAFDNAKGVYKGRVISEQDANEMGDE